MIKMAQSEDTRKMYFIESLSIYFHIRFDFTNSCIYPEKDIGDIIIW